jgi:hypothetical protein
MTPFKKELLLTTRQFRYDRDLVECTPIAKTDGTQFIRALAKGLQAHDAEDEPESREELKAKIRAEVMAELHQRLVVAPTEPSPPEQAQFVRAPDAGLDEFFTLAAQQKEARRRGR